MIHSGAFGVRRTAEEVFDLLSSPERFAPLMPDFESMTMLDATHFTMRTVIAIGEVKGHANLAMELGQASRPSHVAYRGSAIIAGSPLRTEIDFQINPQAEVTEVVWRGEVVLEGMLAMMAGSMLETMGRQNFDKMSERLRNELLKNGGEPSVTAPYGELDFDI